MISIFPMVIRRKCQDAINFIFVCLNSFLLIWIIFTFKNKQFISVSSTYQNVNKKHNLHQFITISFLKKNLNTFHLVFAFLQSNSMNFFKYFNVNVFPYAESLNHMLGLGCVESFRLPWLVHNKLNLLVEYECLNHISWDDSTTLVWFFGLDFLKLWWPMDRFRFFYPVWCHDVPDLAVILQHHCGALAEWQSF